MTQSEPFALYITSFAISPDGRSIIATAAEELAYSTKVELDFFVLEGNTIRHVSQIGIDPDVGEIDQPFAPRFSPDGSRALVLNGLGIAARPHVGHLAVVDLTVSPVQLLYHLPRAYVQQGIDFGPDGAMLFVRVGFSYDGSEWKKRTPLFAFCAT